MNNDNNNPKQPMPKMNKVYLLGRPVKAQKGNLYAMPKRAIVNVAYMYTCPKCAHTVNINLDKTGVHRTACLHCGTVTLVKAIDREEAQNIKKQVLQKNKVNSGNAPKVDDNKPEKGGEKQQEEKQTVKSTTPFFPSRNIYKAKITWGGFLRKKEYELHIGENWIGRKDAELPSDIAVNDSYMSRRSVCIEVISKQSEFFFKMTVRRATNTVRLNGKDLAEGQAIFLNYDDVITLGNTVFTVKKIGK